MDQRRYKKYLTLSTTAMVRPQSVHSSPGVKDKQHQEDVDNTMEMIEGLYYATLHVGR
jgi:hypothetical protein